MQNQKNCNICFRPLFFDEHPNLTSSWAKFSFKNCKGNHEKLSVGTRGKITERLLLSTVYFSKQLAKWMGKQCPDVISGKNVKRFKGGEQKCLIRELQQPFLFWLDKG